MTAAANKTSAAHALLTEARANIAAGWTQHAYARDAYGVNVYSGSASATCWCAVGAIAKHASFKGQHEAYRLLMKAIQCGSIANWNDSANRTQAEVLAAFDLAIQYCNV